MRRGDWMGLASGRRFWPLDPRPDDVEIGDIAHALSHICRYGGHARRFYSVAEHSLIVSHFVPPWLALAALLHDAAEAYLGDIVRPLKKQPCMDGWRESEVLVERAIAARFGIPWPMHPAIKAIDDRIIIDEWAALMPPQADLGVAGEPIGARIRCLAPDEAQRRFLARFRALAGEPQAGADRPREAATAAGRGCDRSPSDVSDAPPERPEPAGEDRPREAE